MPLVFAEPETYEKTVLNDNPLFWYRLGETSGTTAVDEISAINGTYINTPTLGEPGFVRGGGKSVKFVDAQSEYVSLPTSLQMYHRTNQSLEVWIKPDTGFNGGSIYSESANTGVSFTLVITPTYVAFARWNSGWHTLTYNTTITVGNIYHIVATLESGVGDKIYVNGALGTSSGDALPAGSFTLTIRNIVSYQNSPAGPLINFLDATIAEMAGYNYALNLTQVQEHYAFAA